MQKCNEVIDFGSSSSVGARGLSRERFNKGLWIISNFPDFKSTPISTLKHLIFAFLIKSGFSSHIEVAAV